ncbi:hypothetical protein [Microbacterium aurum]
MSLLVTVPRPELARDLEPLPEGVSVLVWPMDAPAGDSGVPTSIDIVVPPYMSADRALPLLAGLQVRLVQGQSIGYEGIERLLPPGTVFANAAT